MSLDDDDEKNVQPGKQVNYTVDREEGRRKKPLTQAERQKLLRERDLKNGITQLNLRVPVECAKFLRWFASRLRKDRNICSLVIECARKCSPPSPTRSVQNLEKSQKEMVRNKRIYFLGKRAYGLRGWRKITMEIALGI